MIGPKGHAYDVGNTRVTKSGSRVCKTCHRNRERARKQRKHLFDIR